MKPSVELIWKDPAGNTLRKTLPWRRPATNTDLSDYIDEYIDLLNYGYKPEGFEYTPLPHCARVHLNGKILAEWHRDTPNPNIGSGEIPDRLQPELSGSGKTDTRQGSGTIREIPPASALGLQVLSPKRSEGSPVGGDPQKAGSQSASEVTPTQPPQHSVCTLPLDLENGGIHPESSQPIENARPGLASGSGFSGTVRTSEASLKLGPSGEEMPLRVQSPAAKKTRTGLPS